MDVRCNRCGNIYEVDESTSDGVACPHCGSLDVSASVPCPECENMYKNHFSYCGHCGFHLAAYFTLDELKKDYELLEGDPCPMTGVPCAERKNTCEPDWGGHGEPAFCHLK